MQARLTTSTRTPWELPDAETSLAITIQIFIAATHLRSLILIVLLSGELRNGKNHAFESAGELSRVNCLVRYNCGIGRLNILSFHYDLWLLLIIIETLGQRWAFVSAFNLVSTKLQSLEILRSACHATSVWRDCADGIQIRTELLRLSRVACAFACEHMRLRGWLGRLTTFTLYGAEISAHTIFNTECRI